VKVFPAGDLKKPERKRVALEKDKISACFAAALARLKKNNSQQKKMSLDRLLQVVL